MERLVKRITFTLYALRDMTDFLEEKKREIRDRIAELKPLVDEYQRLEVAAAALGDVQSNGTTRPASTTAKKRTSSASTPKRRGRPRGSGTRSKEALEIVRAQPGVTIAEMADRMKIKQNYLYRVLPTLAKDGLVSKKGRGWFPKKGTAEAAPVSESPTPAAPKASRAKARKS